MKVAGARTNQRRTASEDDSHAAEASDGSRVDLPHTSNHATK